MIYSMHWEGLRGSQHSGIAIYWNEYLQPNYQEESVKREVGKRNYIFAKYAGKKPDFMQMLADFIYKSEDCSFVYMITRDQEEKFLEFLKKYKLIDLVVYQMPDFITNANHPTMGRRLKLFVLCSPNHFWRDWYGEDGQVENLNAD